MVKLNLTDRRAMLGRLTLELTNKRSALTQTELLRLRALRAEMDEIESDIGFEQNRKYLAAFRKGLRFGFTGAGLTTEEHDIIRSANTMRREAEARSLNAGVLGGGDESSIARSINAMKREAEVRDMQVSPNGGAYPGASLTGGVFVPLEMTDTITSALKDYGPMYRVATIFDTESGALRAYPEENDATISGERLSEGQAASTQDIADVSQAMLSSYRYSSKLIKISTSLVQDFGFPIEEYLSERFAIRIARATNPDFTTGTGSADSQPMGFITAAVNAGGTVIAQGSYSNDHQGGTNTIGVDDLSQLEQLLDPAWRMNPSCAWQMHPNTLGQLRRLKDLVASYVFPGLHENGEDTIYGYPVLKNPNMDECQTTASSPGIARNTIAFGAWDRYVIRRAPPILQVLKQRFADQGQVGYILWWRQDANLIDGGGGAVKVLQNVY